MCQSSHTGPKHMGDLLQTEKTQMLFSIMTGLHHQRYLHDVSVQCLHESVGPGTLCTATTPHTPTHTPLCVAADSLSQRLDLLPACVIHSPSSAQACSAPGARNQRGWWWCVCMCICGGGGGGGGGESRFSACTFSNMKI